MRKFCTTGTHHDLISCFTIVTQNLGLITESTYYKEDSFLRLTVREGERDIHRYSSILKYILKYIKSIFYLPSPALHNLFLSKSVVRQKSVARENCRQMGGDHRNVVGPERIGMTVFLLVIAIVF